MCVGGLFITQSGKRMSLLYIPLSRLRVVCVCVCVLLRACLHTCVYATTNADVTISYAISSIQT